MECSLSIECNPSTVVRGGTVELIVTFSDADPGMVDRILVVEILQPLDGLVVYQHETPFPSAGEALKLLWHPGDDLHGGLYQVSVCLRGEDLHTLTFVSIASATEETEAEYIRRALEHRIEADRHLQTNQLAAAASLEDAATCFSSGSAYESALACWKEAVALYLQIGHYVKARASLREALSALFETVRLRLKNPFSPKEMEIPLPEQLPVSYADVDGVRELAAPIRSETKFDAQIEARINEHVDRLSPLQKLYGLLLLCEEFSVEGDYYERLLHEYYEIPVLKDVCWVGLARCDEEFADEALTIATEAAISKPKDQAYREFLSGSFALIGHVEPFMRNAMKARVDAGSYLMLELSIGAKLQIGGKDQHFTISDETNKTLAKIPINDHTQGVLLPLLTEQFKESRTRLGQLLAV